MKSNYQPFDYSDIPLGYYDEIARKREGMRSYWHNHKFKRVIDGIDGTKDSILDIGCFAGTFLGMIPKEKIKAQVGIDILENQVQYANERYGTKFRKFFPIRDFTDSDFPAHKHFDVITTIEVIEHLTKEQIRKMLDYAYQKLRPGGNLIITTPNYTSLWPLLEILLNRFSDVKYEEQHITRFTYFNAMAKLKGISPDFDEKFNLDYKTTTHLFTPFVAALSFGLAETLSTAVSPDSWKIPLGSILILKFTKNY